MLLKIENDDSKPSSIFIYFQWDIFTYFLIVVRILLWLRSLQFVSIGTY